MQNNTFSRLFVGQNVVTLQRVDSTNNYLKNLLSNSKPLPEGTVILAEDQFAGRGQVNNTWHAEPGQNLTFSLLLKPGNLSISHQFLLNKAISIGINEYLFNIIGEDIKIKWPNDIYFKDKKLGGILIENIIQGNQWKYAVIGIGINVNQINFPDEVKRVTSIKKILQVNYDLKDLLTELCAYIETWYLQFREGKPEKIESEYLRRLYRLNKECIFKSQNNTFRGEITDVDNTGLLYIRSGEKTNTYTFKEVEFIIE